MAAATKKHVKVTYQNSDSGSEGDLEDSDSGLDDNDPDTPDDDAAVSLQQGSENPRKGLADVMAKILKKEIPIHKQVILAKGKTDKEIRKRKKDEEDTETVDHSVTIASHEKKRLWEDMCRVKPDPLEKEKERKLQRIGTRGVVQLFNAVRKQQKVVEDEIQQVGTSERKRDKVLQGVTKDKFFNILKGSNVSVKSGIDDGPADTKKKKANTEDDMEEEGEKKWSILRDDFMMGAKMKDWNKESSSEEEVDPTGPGPDMSDSD